jgi:hypothetical protein
MRTRVNLNPRKKNFKRYYGRLLARGFGISLRAEAVAVRELALLLLHGTDSRTEEIFSFKRGRSVTL